MEGARRVLVLSMLAALVALAGCGGGGDSEPLSKEDFKTKANAACQRYKDASDKLADPQSFEDIAELAPKAQAQFDTLIDDLKALTPPKEWQDEYDALVASAEQAKQALGDLRDAAKAKAAKRIEEIGKKAQAASEKKDAVATKLGLTTCVQA